jgi:hypothetical protein
MKQARSSSDQACFLLGGKLDGGLESFTRNESYGLRGFDLDLLTGLRIHASAGLAIPDFEGAETDKLNGLSFFNTSFDAVDDSIHSTLGVGLGGTERFLDCCGKFYFIHLVVVFVVG